MATTAGNNIVSEGRSLGFTVLSDGTADINQGDQVWIDTSAHAAKSVDSDAHAQFFAGIAMESSYINPYGTKLYTPQVPVMHTGVATMNTTSGDTYNEGDALYIGADAQTVTNTKGGLNYQIGVVKMRPGQSAVAGGAGITIDMMIVHQFPVAGS